MLREDRVRRKSLQLFRILDTHDKTEKKCHTFQSARLLSQVLLSMPERSESLPLIFTQNSNRDLLQYPGTICMAAIRLFLRLVDESCMIWWLRLQIKVA